MLFFPTNLDDFKDQLPPILTGQTRDFYLDELFDFSSGVQEQKYVRNENDYFLNIKALDFINEKGEFLFQKWKMYKEISAKSSSSKLAKNQMDASGLRKIDRDKILNKYDLLIPTKGELRGFSLLNFFNNSLDEDRFIANNQLIVVRPKPYIILENNKQVDLNPEFLHYVLLNTVIYRLNQKTNSKDNSLESVLPNENKFATKSFILIKDLINNKVSIPLELMEQLEIVQKFVELNNKIKQASLELQEFKDQFSAEVYKHWEK